MAMLLAGPSSGRKKTCIATYTGFRGRGFDWNTPGTPQDFLSVLRGNFVGRAAVAPSRQGTSARYLRWENDLRYLQSRCRQQLCRSSKVDKLLMKGPFQTSEENLAEQRADLRRARPTLASAIKGFAPSFNGG
ncbi:hypothetical protein PtA15_11A180 [Puccinia triticina]|uniref:Uncharacterized protein n=1 Tax=Puccinia triticina TaxID=208348 RepID=A0ABY7CW83_9BASI|nr:uncharacterized protein PtA15_11A180 [Puccinia triticina]WAQ89491.1 hypothetical protein PtA15_11A180 [Puccinia triticina]WAR59544.1 hypothetical protein PtB15_11B184 [Puccinia triticina]